MVIIRIKNYINIMARKQRQITQLKELFDSLARSVPDVNDRGILVGYAIIGTLYSFEPISRSEEEITLERMKAIYRTLEKVTTQCLEGEPYDAIAPLQEVVESLFDRDLPTRIDPFLSEILKETNLQRGNYTDRLRRRGISLLDRVNSQGAFYGAKRTLTENYRATTECFTGKRR
jgi:hypothetical protein